MNTFASQPNHSTHSAHKTEDIRLATSVVVCHLFTNFYAQLGRLIKSLVTDEEEPIITQIIDRKGRLWWRIDDTKTHQSYWLNSETEVRQWLENKRLY